MTVYKIVTKVENDIVTIKKNEQAQILRMLCKLECKSVLYVQVLRCTLHLLILSFALLLFVLPFALEVLSFLF